MSEILQMETIACPCCDGLEYRVWAEERGYRTVRCSSCALLYVNPRPTSRSIEAAVRTGLHGHEAGHLDVRARRSARKVARYAAVFRRMFADVWASNRPISWLDVGAGYGEILEAVRKVAPAASRLQGIEPMAPKAKVARSRGLDIIEEMFGPGREKVDIVSMVDVFSHIPDFRAFLTHVVATLQPGGEIFIETGNLADVERREDFPGELGVPDHLVFIGESQLRELLGHAGFNVVRVERTRFDDIGQLGKNVVKRLLGRPAALRIPYRSPYRQLLVRARLRGATGAG